MQLKIENKIENIDKDEWNALLKRSVANTFFQTYEWHALFLDCYKKTYEKIVIVVIRENNVLVGIAPLILVRKGKRSILRFIGHDSSDFTGFIYEKERDDLLSALLGAIRDLAFKWDMIELKFIPERFISPDALISTCTENRLFAFSHEKCISAELDFSDTSFVDELLSKRKLRQMKNRIVAMGGYEVLALDKAEDISPFLDIFFQQHIDQWRVTDTPSFFKNEEHVDFYRMFIPEICRRKDLILIVIKVEERPIAFGFAFTFDKTFLYYKTCYDIDLFKRSPGTILLVELIDYAKLNGFSVFNFGAGAEGYKNRFTNSEYATFSYKIFRKKGSFIPALFFYNSVERVKKISRGEQIISCVKKVKSILSSEGIFGLLRKILLFIHDNLFYFFSVVYSEFESSLDKCSSNTTIESEIGLFREAKLSDLYRLREEDLLGYYISKERYLKTAFSRLKKDYRCFIIEHEKKIVALMWVMEAEYAPVTEVARSIPIGKNALYISDCYTIPSYRRKGLYVEMLKILSVLFNNKKKTICASPRNVASCKAIRKAGFAPLYVYYYLKVCGVKIKWKKPFE